MAGVSIHKLQSAIDHPDLWPTTGPSRAPRLSATQPTHACHLRLVDAGGAAASACCSRSRGTRATHDAAGAFHRGGAAEAKTHARASDGSAAQEKPGQPSVRGADNHAGDAALGVLEDASIVQAFAYLAVGLGLKAERAADDGVGRGKVPLVLRPVNRLLHVVLLDHAGPPGPLVRPAGDAQHLQPRLAGRRWQGNSASARRSGSRACRPACRRDSSRAATRIAQRSCRAVGLPGTYLSVSTVWNVLRDTQHAGQWRGCFAPTQALAGASPGRGSNSAWIIANSGRYNRELLAEETTYRATGADAQATNKPTTNSAT